MSQKHYFSMFERENKFFFHAQNKSIRFIAKELEVLLLLFPEEVKVILLKAITVFLKQRKWITKIPYAMIHCLTGEPYFTITPD